MNFYIADLHFHHRNIVTYEPVRTSLLGIDPDLAIIARNALQDDPERQSVITKSAVTELVQAMNAAIVRRWNAVVKPYDTVYVLGDVSFTAADGLRFDCRQLNGTLYVTPGNHDPGVKSLTDMGLSVLKKIVPHQIGPYKVLLSHHPLPVMALDEADAQFNIHGHMHSRPFQSLRHTCVSLEVTGGVPQTETDLLLRLHDNRAVLLAGAMDMVEDRV